MSVLRVCIESLFVGNLCGGRLGVRPVWGHGHWGFAPVAVPFVRGTGVGVTEGHVEVAKRHEAFDYHEFVADRRRCIRHEAFDYGDALAYESDRLSKTLVVKTSLVQACLCRNFDRPSPCRRIEVGGAGYLIDCKPVFFRLQALARCLFDCKPVFFPLQRLCSGKNTAAAAWVVFCCCN